MSPHTPLLPDAQQPHHRSPVVVEKGGCDPKTKAMRSKIVVTHGVPYPNASAVIFISLR